MWNMTPWILKYAKVSEWGGGEGAEKKEQVTSYLFYINAGNTYRAAPRSAFISPLKCFRTGPKTPVLTFQAVF